MEEVREPVVAGYFYPGQRNALIKMLERFVKVETEGENVISAVCPHAGYIYSGAVAGEVYSKIKIPESVIILGPNHTGYGEPYSVASHRKWLTPLGEVEIDGEIAEKLVEKSNYLEKDALAHEREHSVEVQIPFLQYLKKDVKIVPLVLSGYVDNPAWVEIGETIAEVIKESRRDILIVASSDMTHYESQRQAEDKDHYAIEAILSLDEDELIKRISERNISMCGYGPVIVAMVASKNLGAKRGDLIKYATSGDISGDYNQVVGYAGIIIK